MGEAHCSVGRGCAGTWGTRAKGFTRQHRREVCRQQVQAQQLAGCLQRAAELTLRQFGESGKDQWPPHLCQ